MTHANSGDPAVPSDAAAATLEPAPTPPEAEPWTPERVTKWNRYLDRYVVGGVLLLVLLTAIRPISHSSIWPLLRAGEHISRGGSIQTDTFSYTRDGQPWTNIPWLFEVANWQVFRAADAAFSSDRDPNRGPWFGASALVLLNAILLATAAAIVLGIRHPGPGLWWAAVCVTIALGGFVIPSNLKPRSLDLGIGGLASGAATVDPDTWGLVLLASVAFLLHRAHNAARPRALWFLPALFVIWANVDDSVGFGLVLLAAWTIGLFLASLSRQPAPAPAPAHIDPNTRVHPLSALFVLAACAAVCLLNPSTYRIYPEALGPFVGALLRLVGMNNAPLTVDQLSFFGIESQRYYDRVLGAGAANTRVIYFALVVWLGVLSFLLNWKRFSWPRFLAFAAAAMLWSSLARLAPFFGIVLAAVLTLNGQEWYLGRYGAEGRVGAGWKLFSDGGRSLTIVAVFALLFLTITGYNSKPGDSRFDLGYDDSDLAFSTASFLSQLPLEGRVLNLSVAHGDALIWKAPNRKTFVDSRKGLFPDELRTDLETIRSALTNDDRARWEPLFQKYGGDGPGITTVIVAPGQNPRLHDSLLRSPNWVRLHDGGNAVVFGRVDLPTRDSDLIKEARLDPERFIFGKYEPLPFPNRPPTATSWIDRVLRYRGVKPPQPNVLAAERWLNSAPPDVPLDPAACYMAIREARLALAKDPDDHLAYQRLQAAYVRLMQAEAAILTQQPLDPNSPQPNAYLNFRYRQRLAALRYAIQTAPTPRTQEDRDALAALHFQLASYYESNRAIDLTRDQLEAARALLRPSEVPDMLIENIAQLEEQIAQFKDRLEQLTATQQLNPIQRADFAVQSGFPGIAIEELLASESAGISPAMIRWQLVDLYCQTGEPDKAFDLLEAATPGDPSLATGAGTAAYRQGLVNSLLGYYEYADNYWNTYAIPQLRASLAAEAMAIAQSFVRGEPLNATRNLLELTGTPGTAGYLENQAQWEADLGINQLEGGVPKDVRDPNGNLIRTGAATHFRNALTLRPDHPMRPLLLYYLEKLGEPFDPSTPENAAAPSAESEINTTTTPEPTPSNTPSNPPQPD